MNYAQKLRPWLAALLLCSVAGHVEALQLGEDRAALVARHGAPGAEDRARNTAVYFWEGWSAQVEFQKDAVVRLTYRRNWYLGEPEIQSLLQSNGGIARWREKAAGDGKTRLWLRDDGARASCLAEHALSMTFQVAKTALAGPIVSVPVAPMPAAPPVAAATVPQPAATPAQAPVASTTPPNYPKLLGSNADSDAPPVDAAPASRAVPKLPAEEVSTTAPAEPADAPETAVLQPVKTAGPKVQVTAAAPEPEPAPAPEPPPAAPAKPPEVESGHGGLIFGIIALLGLGAGAAVYLGKLSLPSWIPLRRERVREIILEPESDSSGPTPPRLDGLPRDRFELLVGEIFRRLGYTVELSAALSAGDAIDLTFRRDSETILVQCKYWNSVRVTPKEIQEFFGAMGECGAPRGIVVTMGSFSRDARDFAAGKDIDLMDRGAMEECVAEISRPGENFFDVTGWIEEFVSHSKIFDPECPICRETMVLKSSRTGGTPTWNCRNFPRCPGQREPRLDLMAVAASR